MRKSFLLVSLIIALSFRVASAQDVILGVLEESHGHYAGEPNYRSVRVVFERKGDAWQAFPSDCENQECLKTITSSYPNEVKWSIGFDGKIVGTAVSHNRSDFHWYSDVGQQEIVGTDPVPTVGGRSREFGGYSDAEVYRPLIANSRQYLTDPERWKPFAASPELTTALQQAFRQNFPKLCRLGEADNSKLEPLPYRDEDVKLVKSYESKSGWVLARLHLEAVDCADVEAGFDIDDPWFVIDAKKKTVTYLESGIWLVDAGDYDNDGRSELVFSINRENEGGYEIYYDNFKKHATFKFNYH